MGLYLEGFLIWGQRRKVWEGMSWPWKRVLQGETLETCLVKLKEDPVLKRTGRGGGSEEGTRRASMMSVEESSGKREGRQLGRGLMVRSSHGQGSGVQLLCWDPVRPGVRFVL